MKCCHDPPCPTREKVDSAHQDLGAEKAAPTVPGEELMCQDPGETHSLSSTFWYGTHCNGSPDGTAISAPFDFVISWVTFSSWLKRKPGSPTQPGARLPGAVLQEGRRMSVTPLGDWQQFHTSWLKVFKKVLWEDPKGLECCVGTAALYCQGKEILCEDMHGWGKSP